MNVYIVFYSKNKCKTVTLETKVSYLKSITNETKLEIIPSISPHIVYIDILKTNLDNLIYIAEELFHFGLDYHLLVQLIYSLI